ncbi:hypothetical protein V8F20_002496 [Naviculisporaceae sp. PSN 640]
MKNNNSWTDMDCNFVLLPSLLTFILATIPHSHEIYEGMRFTALIFLLSELRACYGVLTFGHGCI